MRDTERLKNVCDGIGKKKAKDIIRSVGSIEELENMDKSEFTNLDGVGDKTADKIGIWDDDGNPVDAIPENPCPFCGESYENKHTRKGTINVSDFDKVCYSGEGKYDRGKLYTHK